MQFGKLEATLNVMEIPHGNFVPNQYRYNFLANYGEIPLFSNYVQNTWVRLRKFLGQRMALGLRDLHCLTYTNGQLGKTPKCLFNCRCTKTFSLLDVNYKIGVPWG